MAGFPLIGARFVRAGRRVRDRAEPGRRGGAAGVLDASAGEPIIAGAGRGLCDRLKYAG